MPISEVSVACLPLVVVSGVQMCGRVTGTATVGPTTLPAAPAASSAASSRRNLLLMVDLMATCPARGGLGLAMVEEVEAAVAAAAAGLDGSLVTGFAPGYHYNTKLIV